MAGVRPCEELQIPAGPPEAASLLWLRGQVQDGSDHSQLSYLPLVSVLSSAQAPGFIHVLDLSGSPNYQLLC